MFDFPITTPANTTKAAPLRTDLELIKGVIDQVQIAFPPGPQGLLHVTIERGGSLLWPSNEGDGFAWDDFTIDYGPLYEIEDDPVTLQAVTYNLDDSFEHQVNIRINIVPRELIFPEPLPTEELGILQRLERVLLRRRR